MAKTSHLLLAVVALLPFVISKQYLNPTESGFFTLYDVNNNPFRSFCDFESESPFVWTLIESLTLENAQKAPFRKSFELNLPLGKCNTSMSLFRLTSAHRSSILGAYGSKHYRSTCNFDIDMGTGLANRRDYLRFSACKGLYILTTNSARCVEVDYINVRGQSCRKCSVPFYSSTSQHLHIDLIVASTYCRKFVVTDHIANEDVFGHYSNLNPTFSCATNKNSTTAWWIGGAFIE
ncbi:uncharacterized protein TRIADDRAFT_55272 [Trichoplax adhaerens]|uniref:Fibrinogen C-terminal domain-containing protein n=1 Tax=Trichoplax adhaerens TaxID=10228 RepID=B3RUF8_TRIAD|nr:predicted protein [Trichoplax adhaerens]EDV25325.1 predicted protein [Trichoplax adhaerens]|eukprot:XP_002111358.1 predicted protein [Trichoplax adhaerens]